MSSPAAQGELAFRRRRSGPAARTRRTARAPDSATTDRNLDADQPRPRPANQIRKPAIAVEHSAVPGQRRRAFAHGFHEQAIRRFAAPQGHDLPAATTGHHQGIDFAGLDGAKRVLRGLQPSAEPGVRLRPDGPPRGAGPSERVRLLDICWLKSCFSVLVEDPGR